MNDEARLMMRIWESMSDFISTGDKQDAAEGLIRSFVEFGNDIETLYDADGECVHLDRALAAVAAIDGDIEEDGEMD